MTFVVTRAPASRQTRAFQCEGSATQHSCSSASCPVVAKRVQKKATPTEARRGRKGLPETTQQEHTEHGGVKPSLRRRGETGERDACQRTALRSEESLPGDRQPRPHCTGDVVTMNRFSGDLLPAMAGLTWFHDLPLVWCRQDAQREDSSLLWQQNNRGATAKHTGDPGHE